jgi:hypothetical protein
MEVKQHYEYKILVNQYSIIYRTGDSQWQNYELHGFQATNQRQLLLHNNKDWSLSPWEPDQWREETVTLYERISVFPKS